jgi:hypothetical protein
VLDDRSRCWLEDEPGEEICDGPEVGLPEDEPPEVETLDGERPGEVGDELDDDEPDEDMPEELEIELLPDVVDPRDEPPRPGDETFDEEIDDELPGDMLCVVDRDDVPDVLDDDPIDWDEPMERDGFVDCDEPLLGGVDGEEDRTDEDEPLDDGELIDDVPMDDVPVDDDEEPVFWVEPEDCCPLVDPDDPVPEREGELVEDVMEPADVPLVRVPDSPVVLPPLVPDGRPLDLPPPVPALRWPSWPSLPLAEPVRPWRSASRRAASTALSTAETILVPASPWLG